jgi:hypothetical protein
MEWSLYCIYILFYFNIMVVLPTHFKNGMFSDEKVKTVEQKLLHDNALKCRFTNLFFNLLTKIYI